MTLLHTLFAKAGQSPWLDNLRRDWLHNGELAGLVEDGIRGVTSNPTIFAKAIMGQDDYDEQFRTLVPRLSVEDAYWELVIVDIKDALEILRPVHESSSGADGFVSLEVSPTLAHDTIGTIAAGKDLHSRIAKPNLFVKVPATKEGVPAIKQLIADGHSINVTLIFGLDRYDAVMEAYVSGLEAAAADGRDDLSVISSVASFFVSRVDTEVDGRLEKAGASQELFGRAAVAQAQVAYEHFCAVFSGPRWEALAAKGARVQRPLWASTSTKNPAYPDLLYVDSLIGPDTVNTMPDSTIEAFLDHGKVVRTIDADPDAAKATLSELAAAGIDMEDVAQALEDAGVASFGASFTELLASLEKKAASFA